MTAPRKKIIDNTQNRPGRPAMNPRIQGGPRKIDSPKNSRNEIMMTSGISTAP